MVARTLAQGMVAIVVMLVYFAPSIVADRRGRRNVLLLALMNALLGWTIVGWLVTLYWAFHRDSPKNVDRIVRTQTRMKAHATSDAIVTRALTRHVPTGKVVRGTREHS